MKNSDIINHIECRLLRRAIEGKAKGLSLTAAATLVGEDEGRVLNVVAESATLHIRSAFGRMSIYKG